ncbi:hypothetical protein ACFYNO_07020 [Kitasatospora sp. NPDC006697]|uniref:hypothetical protein n=1 Tax=Kitasatospora sp. NPDC006697 TaxID=3364020 RepID=UPI0036A0B37C
MKANRLAAAVLVAATAMLALTACGPDEVDGATGAPSNSAAAPAGSAAPSGGAKPTATAKPSPAKPTATAKPAGSAKPSGGATPSQDCTAAAKEDLAGKQVVEATDNGYQTSIWMKAKPTKFICGPDVPDDGHYDSYGTPAVYTFSNDVKTYVLVGATPQPVSLDAFMKQQDDCLHNPSVVQAPGGCFGNQYLITVTGQNVITNIVQQYHP